MEIPTLSALQTYEEFILESSPMIFGHEEMETMKLAELSLEKLEEEIKELKDDAKALGPMPRRVWEYLSDIIRDLIACPIGREEYIEVLRSKGLLPSFEEG